LLELAPHLQGPLSAGHTLVVPTAQRAAALRLAFATQQLAAGRRAFRTPDVQSLSGWLRGQPSKDADGRPLRRLGASEEWLLWRASVTDAAEQLSVPLGPGLIDAVRQSAALLFEWRIPPAALAQAASLETALLIESLRAIEARLEALSAAASWRTLHDLAADPPPRAPLFAGFSSQTAARRALLAAWAERGIPARELAGSFAEAPAALARAADPAQELAQVAQWCRDRLSLTPTARLLVIVPDLAQRHGEVRRVFDAALDPGYLARGATEGEVSAYALEGGQALLSYAPVSAALRTLRLLTGDVDMAELSAWLQGSFWTRPAAPQRAQLDVWLRTVVPPRLHARQLLQALRAAPAALLAPADEVASLLELLLAALGTGQAGLHAWSGRYAQVFALCGLNAAAPRHRASHTQQVLQRLDELLQECAALPAHWGVTGATEALAAFSQLLARTRFEPATGDAAVTLTAALTDPLLRYDGIWVSGLHAGAIPERTRFDPFIPAALQRQAGVIATDAAALVLQGQQALQTLRNCSHEFIVSAPSHAEDLELTASPLLAPFAARAYAPDAAPEDLAQRIRTSRRIERYQDGAGLVWPAGRPLPSGTRAIELQSRCPFRAYAQLRLGADPLETPVPGITPQERGRLLHRALEFVWRRLGGSTGLAAARRAQWLEQIIAESVAQAASEVLQRADPQAEDAARSKAADATGLLELRRAAIAREQGRAARLIVALCELESARAPFAIQELEAAHRVHVAGALIDVRIDRMDRLEDGSSAILDYKSGRAVTPDWEVERTTHPQLLVYLLAAGAPVSALAVAHLDPKGVVFKGIGADDTRLPGLDVAEDWSQQQQLWHLQVARLAADFVAGEAAVAPADHACDYCHLHAFCRIADIAT
jgi:ATP-dependent helicase/nuclease subunit B